MKNNKIKTLHKLNNQKEIRIGNYLVDGFCPKTKTVYEYNGGHSGRVVTLSPLTSVAGVGSPSWTQVGKLVVACRWSAVYSTRP